MSDSPILDGQALQKTIGERVVVDRVSLSLQPGDVVGLVGPNGAGKTTLLRLLANLLEPSGGKVWVEGRPVAAYTRTQIGQRMGVVPQQFHTADFRFTAEEIVLMGRYPHRRRWTAETARDREIAAQAMHDTNTRPFAPRVITDLSGGERQRVTVARALAQTPRVLLLDEPTASLDLCHQLQMLQLMRTLARRDGLAVVAALHDLHLASRFCDRLLLLKEGRVVAEGTPAAVLTPARLADVFDVQAQVGPDPVTGGLLIRVIGPIYGGSAGAEDSTESHTVKTEAAVDEGARHHVESVCPSPA